MNIIKCLKLHEAVATLLKVPAHNVRNCGDKFCPWKYPGNRKIQTISLGRLWYKDLGFLHSISFSNSEIASDSCSGDQS